MDRHTSMYILSTFHAYTEMSTRTIQMLGACVCVGKGNGSERSSEVVKVTGITNSSVDPTQLAMTKRLQEVEHDTKVLWLLFTDEVEGVRSSSTLSKVACRSALVICPAGLHFDMVMCCTTV